ncbi:MAG: ATP-binding protein [Alphaproteobacteria bacterium]
MTVLSRFLRTTAFKLSAIYIAVFSAFSVFFVLYISYTANIVLNEQVRDTIRAELLGLSDQYRSGGLIAVVEAINQRAYQPGASLYLVTDVSNRILAGNVSQVSSQLLSQPGIEPITVPYARFADEREERTAMVQVVRLTGGYRILVGRDIGEREAFRAIIGSALGWALALMIGLAILSWFFVSRRVLKRIDSLSATGRQIMKGDLSGRLEVVGTGDEFDRLAESLNAMLERIESLLYGLKDVSNNIAHDLKTPLTRLRNRVEAALAGPTDAHGYREALEATIEESDRLIRTFDALLLIARIEAGSPAGEETEIDAAEIVRDVAELYEPVAEEAGLRIVVAAPAPACIHARRELISQAVANLVDNAIKYAVRGDAEPDGEIHVSAARREGAVVLSVADNGPGIPQADRERVLQRFVRLEESRSQPGSGLGLSLVSALVQLMGGSITLGDANPGLVVTLTLPVE